MIAMVSPHPAVLRSRVANTLTVVSRSFRACKAPFLLTR